MTSWVERRVASEEIGGCTTNNTASYYHDVLSIIGGRHCEQGVRIEGANEESSTTIQAYYHNTNYSYLVISLYLVLSCHYRHLATVSYLGLRV